MRNSTIMSSRGSAQKNVLAAPPQKKSPALPGISVDAGAIVVANFVSYLGNA